MTGDMDPSEAAAFAEQSPEMGSEPIGDAELGSAVGSEPETGQSVMDALWNTQPDPPLETVESPWNPDIGGMSRVYRGLQKMADVDGMPAIADVLIGLAEEASGRNLGDAVSSDDSDGDGDGDSETAGLDIEVAGDPDE